MNIHSRDGQSNNGCDGSSSEDENNRKLDMNHIGKKKRQSKFSDRRKGYLVK